MTDATNVSYAKPAVGGAIYAAPAGTTLPTDATTTLASTYKSLGFVSEDGVTNANSPETEVINAWGGAPVLTVQTGRPDSFKFTLIEITNVEVLKLVYGADNVTGTALSSGIKVSAGAGQLDPVVLVIDMVLKNALKRIVIPVATVADVGEIAYVDNDAVGFETTVSATADASGYTHYEYMKTPTVPAG